MTTDDNYYEDEGPNKPLIMLIVWAVVLAVFAYDAAHSAPVIVVPRVFVAPRVSVPPPRPAVKSAAPVHVEESHPVVVPPVIIPARRPASAASAVRRSQG